MGRELPAVLGRTEPRVYTPPLRELTPETTLGFAVCDFAEMVLGIDLLPWERWLFVHALEITGSLDGEWRFRYRKVVCLVARQNGKTVMGVVLSAFFLFALEVDRILGTSLNLAKAEEVWEKLIEIIEGSPELASQLVHVYRKNGHERLKLTGGRTYAIAAIKGSASTSGGRGDSNDLVLLDELREHRTWDAWSATTKSTNARPLGMTWCMTNAGDVNSVVLRKLRVKAHVRLGDPDGFAFDLLKELPKAKDEDDSVDTLGWFEWSAPPGCDVDDVEALAQANPSLGYGFMELRTLLSDAETDDEPDFRAEVLCQFVEVASRRAFPGASWSMSTDETSEIAEGQTVYFGVDVSADRSMTSIAACGMRADGTWHVELVARDVGIDWAVDWISERASRGQLHLAWQKNGATVSTVGDRLRNILNVVTHEMGGTNLTSCFGRFWDAIAASDPESGIRAAQCFHRPQPDLDMAAGIAVQKPLRDGEWVFDRNKSPGDISALCACVMAFGAATISDDKSKKPLPSAYNDEHALVYV